MSTAARELEELRKAREAARLQAEEEKRIADEKAAVAAKKNAFLSRAAAFQQKKGPSEEEVKQQIQKESQKRSMGRKLNKLLAGEPGVNPMAAELGLRGKASNQNYVEKEGDWELVEDPGQRPYYWNRVTNETTYDSPFERNVPKPPPPPPPRMLLPTGMGSSDRDEGIQPSFIPKPSAPAPPAPPQFVMPPPPPPSAVVTEEDVQVEVVVEPVEPIEEVVEAAVAEDVPVVSESKWYYVEDPNTPYYWNIETNETTLEAPPEYDGKIYGADGQAETTATNSVSWQEEYDENGEVFYRNLANENEFTRERPEGGVVYVNTVDEEGNTSSWQEYYDESGQPYYFNAVTQESTYDKPVGTTILVVEYSL